MTNTRLLKNALLTSKNTINAGLRLPLVGRTIRRLKNNRIRVGPCTAITVGFTDVQVADLWWGFYEAYEIAYVQRFLPPAMDVVELGTSLGVVTSQIAMKLGMRRLITVEANQALIPIAARNVKRNAPDAHVRYLHGAIDYQSQGATVSFSLDASQWSRVGSTGTVIDVPRVSLSGILAQEHIGDYALVSDIEGAEAGILTSDADALIRCRLIVIELHDSASTSIEDLLQGFQNRGYMLIARSGFFRRGAVCVFSR